MAKPKKPPQHRLPTRAASPALPADQLLGDIRALIETAREQTARAVNSALVGLYWHIGKRIREDVLKEQRAGYGQEIVSALRRQLSWTHFKDIIYLDDPLKRGFYAEMCRWRGLLSRLALLSSATATAGGHRPKTWKIPGGRQGADGTLSALAGKI
jgi:hypothetical protein